MNRIGLVLAWIATAGVVTTAAWQVVGAAEDQISEDPIAPVIALTTSEPTSATATSSNPPGESQASTPTSVDPGSPATSAPSDTSVTGDTSNGTTTSSTTSTTQPSTTSTSPSSTTTTTVSGSSGTAVIPTTAGTLTVSHQGDQVFLVAATPLLGYSVEVVDDGPSEVRVRFESLALTGGESVEVRARMRDGELSTEISTES